MIIEAKVIEYLSQKLNIPVSAEDPEDKPDEFVTVDLIAGGETNHIEAATLSVVSHSISKLKAAVLNEKVCDDLLNITELPEISSCKIGGKSSDVDTATKSYRYETIFNFIFF